MYSIKDKLHDRVVKASNRCNTTSMCMAAASGSSMPNEFLNLIMVSTSSPFRSSFPGGITAETNLKMENYAISFLHAEQTDL